MTRDEVKEILKEINVLYPESRAPGNPTLLVDLWTEVLKNEEYDAIHGCLVRFVKNDTSGYAPKVGQLLSMKAGQGDDRGLEDWGVWRE